MKQFWCHRHEMLEIKIEAENQEEAEKKLQGMVSSKFKVVKQIHHTPIEITDNEDDTEDEERRYNRRPFRT